MAYQIIYTSRASRDLEELKKDKGKKKVLKAVCKTIRFLAENPKHPSLQTHRYHSLPEIYPGQKIWEAYAQDNTPAAQPGPAGTKIGYSKRFKYLGWSGSTACSSINSFHFA